MATMTQTPAPSTASKIANLTADVAALADKISKLKAQKLREEAAFAQLKTEEETIGKRFAESGGGNPASVQDIDYRLRSAGMSLRGLTGMISEHERSYSGLYSELVKLQLAAAKEQELETIEALKREAMAIAGRVAETIHTTIENDLVRFQQIRVQLGKVADSEFAKNQMRSWPITPAAAQSRQALKQAETKLREVLRPIAKLIA
jgi:hypothetical protein